MFLQCRFTIGDYVDIAISPPNGPKRFDQPRFDQQRFDRFEDRDLRRDGGGGGGGARRRRGGGGGGGGGGDRRPRQF